MLERNSLHPGRRDVCGVGSVDLRANRELPIIGKYRHCLIDDAFRLLWRRVRVSTPPQEFRVEISGAPSSRERQAGGLAEVVRGFEVRRAVGESAIAESKGGVGKAGLELMANGLEIAANAVKKAIREANRE